VDDLLRPDELSPPKTVYLAWLEALDRLPENVREPKSRPRSEGADLKTVSNTDDFQLVITAEDDPREQRRPREQWF
jgi:hypothetical protein